MVEPTLEELYAELRKEIRAMPSMSGGELAKLSSKLGKVLRDAVEVGNLEIEGQCHMWASHDGILPIIERKRHAMKAVRVLAEEENRLMFADALANLGALNLIFMDDSIDSIYLTKLSIVYRSTDDGWENLVKMAETQRLLADLLESLEEEE